MNKKIQLLAICLVLFCTKSIAQMDSVKQLLPCEITNEKIMDHLIKALLNEDMMIGVFEKRGLNNFRVCHLKSGIVPELDQNYLKNIISSNLIKLSTKTIIKGNFDSLIFIKIPSFAIAEQSNPYLSNPVFYSESIWILLLEKAFTKDGSSKMEWVGKLNGESKNLFNETTVFLEAFETFYALCIKWPSEKVKPSEIISTNEEMVNDLTMIAKILEWKNKEREIEALKKAIEKNECMSTCGKMIAEKIVSSLKN